MTVARLVRSVMFTPGTRGDRIAKAAAGGAADVVVADLEDAVAPNDKEAARATVRSALDEPCARGVARWVRVNTWSSGLARGDTELVVAGAPDAIVVPKAERTVDLELMDVLLTRLEQRNGLPVGRIGLVPIIESAAGVLHVEAILGASGRVSAVAFGAEDLAADAGLRRSRANTEVHHARSQVALAAAQARVPAIDQVFVDLEDEEGIEAEAREARALGYRGKMVLHPKQIEPVHRAFSPTSDEVSQAERLLEAVGAASVGTGGVLRFEGRMVDVPLIEQARRILADRDAIGQRQA